MRTAWTPPADAFDARALHRREAPEAPQARRHRRHQRASGGSRARWSSSPASITRLPSPSCSNPGEEICAERNTPRPDRAVRPARRAQPDRAPEARHPPARQGRLPLRLSSCVRRRRSTPPRSSARRCGPTSATRADRSTSSATCTAAPTSWRRCCSKLGYSVAWTGEGANPPRHHYGARRAAAPSSSATSSTAAPARPTSCASSWPWSPPGTAICVPGNHDVKFVRWLNGRKVQLDARARSHRRRRSKPSRPRSEKRGQGVPRRARQPPLARRRPPGRRPRRHQGGHASAAPRAPCASSASTARPPARPTSSACPFATTGRPTIAAPTTVVYGHTPVLARRVAQQHALHRHRLRVRRQADGAALAREGDRLGAGRAQSIPSRSARSATRTRPGALSRHAGRARRPARPRRRHRQAHHQHEPGPRPSPSTRPTPPPRWR